MLVKRGLIYEFWDQEDLGQFKAEIIGERGLWNKSFYVGLIAVEKHVGFEPSYDSHIRCVAELPQEVVADGYVLPENVGAKVIHVERYIGKVANNEAET